MATATITVEFYDGSTWQDITADVFPGFTFSMGLRGAAPTDRVAAPGSLDFEVDNSAANSGGKLGYYSPDNANLRTGWKIGAKVRVKMVSGGNTRYWLYRIKDINVTPGLKGARRVSVTAVDYMDEFNIRKLSGLSVQTNQYGDQLLTTLVATMPFAPTATSYQAGLYSMPYAFHDERNEDTYSITALQKIAQSDLSYIYVDGDATGGETLKYEAPQTRYTTTTSAATFSDTMIDLDVTQVRDGVYNDIKVTTFPAAVGTDYEVIVTTPNEIVLEPLEANKKVTLRFLDTTERRIAAKDIQDLVADTDYKMSGREKTFTGNLTADLTITKTTSSNDVTFTLTNGNATRKGYVWIQLRGIKITLYDKYDSLQSDSTSITTYGQRTLNYSMPYQSSSAVGDIVAVELLRRYKTPFTNIRGMTYNANRSTTFMGYALTLGIGSRVTITETVTGINRDFFINGFECSVEAGGIINMTYSLEYSYGSGNYFILGTSALDGSDVLLPL